MGSVEADSPFKEDQLEMICDHLKQFHLFRDLMLFVLGVNLGLRYSDLCKLRFSDFMDGTGHFFDQIPPRLETQTASGHTDAKSVVMFRKSNFKRSQRISNGESIWRKHDS